MSLARLVFPQLGWDEFLHILSYLSIREIYASIGHLNRSGWLTFLREKTCRQANIQRLNTFHLLPKLDGHDRVLLVSYPRSGNSFLRQCLETMTGIVTGSDSRPNRPLSAQLLSCGYKGEGITDESVWIIKSHYPERLGYIKFPVSRIILVVRNPFDAILSYFYMAMTNTHSKSLTTEVCMSLQLSIIS